MGAIFEDNKIIEDLKNNQIEVESLYDYVKEFGFSKKTGVDLLGESSGIFFDYERVNNLVNERAEIENFYLGSFKFYNIF